MRVKNIGKILIVFLFFSGACSGKNNLALDKTSDAQVVAQDEASPDASGDVSEKESEPEGEPLEITEQESEIEGQEAETPEESESPIEETPLAENAPSPTPAVNAPAL